MDVTNNRHIIGNYLLEFDSNDLRVVIDKIIKDGVINLKVVRERSIIRDYRLARKNTDKNVQEIYDDLSYKYNLSFSSIRQTVLSMR